MHKTTKVGTFMKFASHCCFLLAMLPTVLFAQEEDLFYEASSYELLKSVEVKVNHLSTDNLQNVFAITRNGEVIKYNSSGKELGRYNEFSLGMPSHLDATNPFQILLFYPDFMTVVTLNSTLNKIAAYELFDLDLNYVNDLCFSNDGNIWLYDATTFQVKKVDRNSRVLLTSQNLTFEFEDALNPNFLVQRENILFVNDPEQGILFFDIYGQYDQRLPIKELTDFQVLDNRLLFFEEDKLVAMDLLSKFVEEIKLPSGVGPEDMVRLEKSRLFVAKEKTLDFYSY